MQNLIYTKVKCFLTQWSSTRNQLPKHHAPYDPSKAFCIAELACPQSRRRCVPGNQSCNFKKGGNARTHRLIGILHHVLRGDPSSKRRAQIQTEPRPINLAGSHLNTCL